MPAATTTGVATATQNAVVIVPAGGSVVLVNRAGVAVSVIRIAGQGVYRLDVFVRVAMAAVSVVTALFVARELAGGSARAR